jgi:hypothetical protein
MIRPGVGTHDRAVATLAALDVERPHAVGAHVRQVHRLDGFVEATGGHVING